MTKTYIDPLAYKYVPAFTRAVLELNRVLREPAKINWRMVEYLRHMNFILLEAVQVGELIVQVDS